MEFLFVYGTLRPETAPTEIRDVMKDLPVIGSATAPGRLYDLGEYPGAIFQETGTAVCGIVLELPAQTSQCAAALRRLDHYEGVGPGGDSGSLFKRKRLAVSLEDGREISCWVYEYNRIPAPDALIKSGRYPLKRTAYRGPQF